MKVLVVDDELSVQNFVKGCLETNKPLGEVEVHAVSTFKLAIAKMSECPDIQLVITDYDLGDENRNGVDLLDIFQEERPYVARVLMSGSGKHNVAGLEKLNGFVFVTKPFKWSEIIVACAQAFSMATPHVPTSG